MADAYGSRGGETGLCNKCKGIATAKLPINPPTQKSSSYIFAFMKTPFFLLTITHFFLFSFVFFGLPSHRAETIVGNTR